MKRRCIVVLFLCGSYLVDGQDFYSYSDIKEGKSYEIDPSIMYLYPKDSLYNAGNYRELIHKYTDMESLKNPVRLYNIAASYDKLEMLDSCMYYLQAFMDISQDDRPVLYLNDFENLKSHPDKWEAIIRKIDSLFLITIGNVENKQLALEIFHISIERYRNGIRFIDDIEKYDTIKKGNVITIEKKPLFITSIEKIVKKHGFPTVKKAGRYAVFQVYDVLQHSNSLVKYYPKAKKVFKIGELDFVLYALMTDRVLCSKHKKQIYGTQWQKNTFGTPSGPIRKYEKKYSGNYILYPVKDFAHVNERRKQMGFAETVEDLMMQNQDRGYLIPEEYYKKTNKKNKQYAY
jgi:hypothetical protein